MDTIIVVEHLDTRPFSRIRHPLRLDLTFPKPGAKIGAACQRAGVTQLVECNLAKVDVAGSNPVSRSRTHAFSDRIPLPAPHNSVPGSNTRPRRPPHAPPLIFSPPL